MYRHLYVGVNSFMGACLSLFATCVCECEPQPQAQTPPPLILRETPAINQKRQEDNCLSFLLLHSPCQSFSLSRRRSPIGPCRDRPHLAWEQQAPSNLAISNNFVSLTSHYFTRTKKELRGSQGQEQRAWGIAPPLWTGWEFGTPQRKAGLSLLPNLHFYLPFSPALSLSLAPECPGRLHLQPCKGHKMY